MLASSEPRMAAMLNSNQFPGVQQVAIPGLLGIKTPVQLARYYMRLIACSCMVETECR